MIPRPRREGRARLHHDVLSYGWSCPKFITPRYTAVEIEHAAAPLRKRIVELESRLKALGEEP